MQVESVWNYEKLEKQEKMSPKIHPRCGMNEKRKGKKGTKFNQELKTLPSKCNVQIMVVEGVAGIILEGEGLSMER